MPVIEHHYGTKLLLPFGQSGHVRILLFRWCVIKIHVALPIYTRFRMSKLRLEAASRLKLRNFVIYFSSTKKRIVGPRQRLESPILIFVKSGRVVRDTDD